MTPKERAREVYSQLTDSMAAEVDIGIIERAIVAAVEEARSHTSTITDIHTRAKLDELSALGQCIEEHVWPGHPKHDALVSRIAELEAALRKLGEACRTRNVGKDWPALDWMIEAACATPASPRVFDGVRARCCQCTGAHDHPNDGKGCYFCVEHYPQVARIGEPHRACLDATCLDCDAVGEGDSLDTHTKEPK